MPELTQIPEEAYDYDVPMDHITLADPPPTVVMTNGTIRAQTSVIGELDDHRLVFLGATGEPALLPGWTVSDSGEGGGGPEGDGE
jgi:hypothetical protein